MDDNIKKVAICLFDDKILEIFEKQLKEFDGYERNHLKKV
jgi:hypothetical protein